MTALPPEVLAEIGEYPEDYARHPAWWGKCIAVVSRGVLHGQPWRKLLETVRGSANAAGRVLPFDVILEAGEILRLNSHALKNIGGTNTVHRKPLPCYPSPCTPDAPCRNHGAKVIARSEPR